VYLTYHAQPSPAPSKTTARTAP